MAPRRAAKIEALVVNAIRRLQDVQGSSSREISNYISQEYDVPAKDISRQVQLVLQRGLSYGILQQTKGGHYACSRDHLAQIPVENASAGDGVMEPCPEHRKKWRRYWRRIRERRRRARERSRARRRRLKRQRSKARAVRRRRSKSRRRRRRRRSRRGGRTRRRVRTNELDASENLFYVAGTEQRRDDSSRNEDERARNL